MTNDKLIKLGKMAAKSNAPLHQNIAKELLNAAQIRKIEERSPYLKEIARKNLRKILLVMNLDSVSLGSDERDFRYVTKRKKLGVINNGDGNNGPNKKPKVLFKEREKSGILSVSWFGVVSVGMEN